MTSASYTVQGMTCGHCAASVTTELSKIIGVSDVNVDCHRFAWSSPAASRSPDTAVADAVQDAGYQVVI
jgi:copper chaperone